MEVIKQGLAFEKVGGERRVSTIKPRAVSHGLPFPIFSSLRLSGFHKLRSLFTEFKSTLIGQDRTTVVDIQDLKDICYKLGRIGPGTLGLELPGRDLQYKELRLAIPRLDNSKFMMLLPPPAIMHEYESSISSGNAEEHTGSSQKFIAMLPAVCQDISEKASPLGLVPKLLPFDIISKEARYVGSCFWTWLCIVDDLTENAVGETWRGIEDDLFRVFGRDHLDFSAYNNKEHNAIRVSLALRHVIETTDIHSSTGESDEEWRREFKVAVSEIVRGFKEERPLLASKSIEMRDWMKLRVITISVRPFLVLARADLGLPPTLSRFGNPLEDGFMAMGSTGPKLSSIRRVECLLQLIMGLQNDILGWEKDALTQNPLSAIQILVSKEVHPAIALHEVIQMHNDLVQKCSSIVEHIMHNTEPHAHDEIPSRVARSSVFSVFRHWAPRDTEVGRVREYLKLILGFANGMATWMAKSKRYSTPS